MATILRIRFLATACGVIPAIGCSAAPPPPAAVEVAAPPAPPAPPEPAARWVRTGGETSFGVPWGEERAVLVGGRRAILGRDGALRPEVAPLPEPLEELFLVPTEAGGPRLVGRSAHAVYRLDDPLGPAVTLARTEGVPLRAGAGPGVVGVWARGVTARFLDVVTGEPRAMSGLVQPVFVSGMAFRSVREGALLLGPAGLFVTSDGGASLRPVGGSYTGVEVRGSALVAHGGGGDVAVDPVAGKVGEPPPPPAERGTFEAWVAAGGGDPLLAAARGGVRLDGGDLLVANAHVGVARVDPWTAAIRTAIPLPRADAADGPLGNGDSCQLGRAKEITWLDCEHADRQKLWAVATAGPQPVLLGAAPVAPGAPALGALNVPLGSTSPSGGVQLADHARQPDGTWRAYGTAEGALADGRSVRLAIPYAAGDPAVYPGLQIAGPGGSLEVLPQLRFVRTPHPWLVGAIEESAEHLLSFVIADGDDDVAVTQAPGREAAFRKFVWARLHAGHGIAASKEGLFASTDGGITWEAIPAPEGLIDATLAEAKLERASTDGRGPPVEVSEVGASIGPVPGSAAGGGWIRLGWGAPAPVEAGSQARPGIEPVPRLEGPALDSEALERRLVCTSPAGATAAPARPAEPPKRAAPRPPPSKTTHHAERSIMAGAGRVTLSLDAPDWTASSPVTLTLRWTEDERSGREISVSGPRPGGLDWEPRLVLAHTSGTQVVAWVTSGTRGFLLHGKRGGRLAQTEIVTNGRAPWVTLGATPDDPVSWVQRSPSGSTVMLWRPGHAPRPLTSVPYGSIGPASHGSLPVFLDTGSTLLLRLVSFPLSGDPPAPPTSEPVPLDGWINLGGNYGRGSFRLPVCGARPPAMTMTLYWPIAVRVDGVDERPFGAPTTAELRVGAGGACIAGVRRWATRGVRGIQGVPRYRRIEADLVTQHAVVVPFDGSERAVVCTLE
jgi:hypothetical protein